jgi:acetyl esterase
MTTDPQMQQVLDQLTALGGRPIETLTPDEARRQPTPAMAVQELLKQRGLPEEEPVGKIDNFNVPGPEGNVGVRLYSPDGPGPFPLLVYYHGGGWVIAGIDAYDASCRALCNAAGCIVASIEYRMAPEHRFPAAVEDSFAALQYLMANAAAFNADPRRVAVAGESAGGNLATVMCLLARDRGGVLPSHQLLVYPVTTTRLDFPSVDENAAQLPLNKLMLPWFYSYYLARPEDAQSPYVSPLSAPSLSGLPQATVILAELDPLRDEGHAYAQRLSDAGVPTTATIYPGVTHEFFGMRAVVEQARNAMAQAATALRTAFGTVASGAGADLRALLLPGTPVTGSDGERVGKVKVVRETDFQLDRSMARDLYVPFDAVASVNGSVSLKVPAGQVGDMGWPTP